MAMVPNPQISKVTREAMVERFTEMNGIYEREAKETLGVSKLMFSEIQHAVFAADDDVFAEFGFRMRELFISE